MLKHLTLRRFIFIEEATVEFAAGFCALTGETGAGKSLLVEALALLAGGKPSSAMVSGANDLEIEAVFDFAGVAAVRKFLYERALCGDGDEMIVRRVVAKAARQSRAFVNGRQVPLAVLAEAVSGAVDICGQHHHYSLHKAAAHRVFLDNYAGAKDKAAAVYDAHQQWTSAAAALQQAQESAAAARLRSAALTEELAELEQLGFSVEHWEEQNRQLTRLENFAELAAGGGEVRQLLEDSTVPGLSQARRRLSALLRLDGNLADALQCVEEATTAAEEAARALTHYADDLPADPQQHGAAERFVGEAHRLARKYQLSDPSLLAACITDKKKELAVLCAQSDLAALANSAAKWDKKLHAACATLTKKRQQAAQTLAKTVTATLHKLSMPAAKLYVQLTPLAVSGAHGAEKVELQISTRKNSPPAAIAEVASGGELSRLGLALQLAAGERHAKPVTVFDEVDAGIGGAAASVVGKFLQTLGKSQQVLCVTHLAQVAAHADCHWRVQATDNHGVRGAHIKQLCGGERVEELARIVGGAVVNEAARANAADLLRQSRRQQS